MSTLFIVLEFARTDSPEDPYAFHFEPQSYTLRSSSGGRKRVHLDWSPALLRDLHELGQPRSDPATMQRVGRQLRSFLEPAGWSWTSREIVEAVQRSRPVHLTIRSAAAELYALPWELLTLEGTGQCVGEIPGLLVRYEWPETTTTPPAVVHGRGRILVAWSEAGGAVPVEEHVGAMENAARTGGFDFDRVRDVVSDVSLGRLADALEVASKQGQPYVALHLLCHGGASGETFGLVLNDEATDSGVVVDAWRLRQLLAPFGGAVRMVVLSACESANARGLFDSVALALHRTGIQAVIASRFLLSVIGSISLVRTLYRELWVRESSLEQAFAVTRRSLARDASKLDWASLQLYARVEDGCETYPFIDTTPVAPIESPPMEQEHMIESIDYSTLDLTALLELRDRAAAELLSRFQREQALISVDLGGSSVSAHRVQAADGQRLIERYRDLIEPHIKLRGGRIFIMVDNRLDVCFPTVGQALDATFSFSEATIAHNYSVQREHLLTPRIALHYGAVFTDGDRVVGEAVDGVRAIVQAARGNVLWLSREAMNHTSNLVRATCNLVQDCDVISAGKRMGLFWIPLRADEAVPESVLVVDTGDEIVLPRQDIISFGRLDRLPDGTAANDIWLTLPNREQQLVISRWHFELRRSPRGGHVVRVLSSQQTEVDNRRVKRGDEAPLRSDTTVRLSRKVTLQFRTSVQATATRMGATRNTEANP